MIHGTVKKTIEFECPAIDEYDTKYLEVPIEENFDTIKAYLFEKRYEVPYTDTTWLIEKDAREFMRDLEDKWNHNEIDTFSLYRDEDFLEFVRKHERIDIDQDELDDMFEDFFDECRDKLIYQFSRQELEDLRDEYNYGIEVNGYYDNWNRSSDIDIDELIEDNFDDEEEEEDD